MVLPKLSAAANTSLDTSLFSTVLVAFVCPHLADSTLASNECLSVLLTLLDTWVAIQFRLVRHKPTILHNCATNSTFSCDDLKIAGERQGKLTTAISQRLRQKRSDTELFVPSTSVSNRGYFSATL